MSRVIVDSLGGREGLVVAGGVERELADELASEVDRASIPSGTASQVPGSGVAARITGYRYVRRTRAK